ncbi:MAG: P-loop NTPase [Planctomycetota bacterium]
MTHASLAPSSARDQADGLRDLVRREQAGDASAEGPRARPRPVVIAIASGKGGVGKTTLAVNLAVALAETGRRIALLDADLGTANADVLCGLAPRIRLDAALLPDAPALPAMLHSAPGGFALLPGAVGVGSGGELTGHHADRLVGRLPELYGVVDVLVIDTGAGVQKGVVRWLEAADHRLIVTTPEPPAIADAYALLKVLSRRSGLPEPGRLVVNQARHEREAVDVHARMRAVGERFLGVSVAMLGSVRRDRRVGEAVRRQRPLLATGARGPAVRDIRRLARGLYGAMRLAAGA